MSLSVVISLDLVARAVGAATVSAQWAIVDNEFCVRTVAAVVAVPNGDPSVSLG